MKKYILGAFTLVSAVTMTVTQAHQFGQLTQNIQQSAEKWVVLCDEHLTLEQKTAYLNLLHLLLQSSDITIKCIQMLQEDEKTAPVSERFGRDMLEFIQSYYTKKQELFKKHNKPTEENRQRFEMTLEHMINTLSEHIFAHYYTALYKHVATIDASALTCMFDKEGLIAPENRTTLLPKNIV